MLYVHAYQSAVWNKAASARIKMGRAVVLGDLVVMAPTAANEETVQSQPLQVVSDAARAAAKAGKDPFKEDPTKHDNEVGAGEQQSLVLVSRCYDSYHLQSRFSGCLWFKSWPFLLAHTDEAALIGGSIHEVNEADLAAGRFSLGDVVLPLPGHSVVYPSKVAAVAAVYSKCLKEDGVTLPVRKTVWLATHSPAFPLRFRSTFSLYVARSRVRVLRRGVALG